MICFMDSFILFSMRLRFQYRLAFVQSAFDGCNTLPKFKTLKVKMQKDEKVFLFIFLQTVQFVYFRQICPRLSIVLIYP